MDLNKRRFVAVCSHDEYMDALSSLARLGYKWGSEDPMMRRDYWYLYEEKGRAIFHVDDCIKRVTHSSSTKASSCISLQTFKQLTGLDTPSEDDTFINNIDAVI